MSTPLGSREERAQAFIIERGLTKLAAEPIAADASVRLFRRIGDDEHSFVLMAEIDSESFERVLGMARFFEKAGLPAARIVDSDAKLSVALFDDLGRRSLRTALEATPEAQHSDLLWSALELSARLQAATDQLTPDCPAYHIRFDAAVFRRELEFFRQNFRLPKTHDVAALEADFASLCERLVATPQVLTHRDFHIDNLLLQDSAGPAMVDFQDARMGPRSYDLASLLGDRDIQRFVTPAASELLLVRFAELRHLEAPTLLREFQLASVQRGLKAVGTFAYQSRVRGRAQYDRFIRPTLERVHAAAVRDGRLPAIERLAKAILESRSKDLY